MLIGRASKSKEFRRLKFGSSVSRNHRSIYTMDDLLNGDVSQVLCNGNDVASSPVVEEPDLNLPDGEGKAPDEPNSQTTIDSGISTGSSFLSESESPNDELQSGEIPKLKKRGKNYPPPLVPSTATPKIPVPDTFTSDEDDEPPHSNIPLSQRRKNGYCTVKSSPSSRKKKSVAALKRGTRTDREILNDIVNPKPSTSAALVREMTRIFNSVKNGATSQSQGTARTRDLQLQSSLAKSSSLASSPNSAVKRPVPSRKLALSHKSKKKKLNLTSTNEQSKKESKGDGSEQSSEKEDLLDLDSVSLPLPRKKRPVPPLVISSSDEEGSKPEDIKPRINGPEQGGQAQKRKGKRKTEETDGSEVQTQGVSKKLKESDTCSESEHNSESRLNGGAIGGVDEHMIANVKVEVPQNVTEGSEDLPLVSDVKPEARKNSRGRKKKVAIFVNTEKSPSPVPEDQESNALRASPVPNRKEETDPMDSDLVVASTGIDAPVITIVSQRPLPSRRSVRERRARQIDNAWIY